MLAANPPALHIRPANTADAAVLSALAYASKAHWPYSASQMAAWRDDLHISPAMLLSCPTWVAQSGALAAGFYMLVPASAHWQLEHLWVAPASMRQGVGRALLAHAAGLAAQAGASALRIDSDPYAEAFYLACGARRVDVVAAPIAGEPQRVRPQMLLPTHPD